MGFLWGLLEGFPSSVWTMGEAVPRRSRSAMQLAWHILPGCPLCHEEVLQHSRVVSCQRGESSPFGGDILGEPVPSVKHWTFASGTVLFCFLSSSDTVPKQVP